MGTILGRLFLFLLLGDVASCFCFKQIPSTTQDDHDVSWSLYLTALLTSLPNPTLPYPPLPTHPTPCPPFSFPLLNVLDA